VSTAGSNSYTYDANGNMTAGAGRSFTYNLENKPLTITIGGQTTTFVYDGDNGRVKKIVGSTTTRYISQLYECENMSCSRMIFAGSERVATLLPSGGVHYYHPDHLGSANVITDETGAKVQNLAYYPYGATRTNSSPVTPVVDVPYKYTGKPLDSSTSLYYYGARYYDPVLARFLSADTLVQNPRDPQSLNRYTYAGSNPFLYTDPTGHFKIKFTKFFSRAFGDVGTAIVGVAGQALGTYFYFTGNFVLANILSQAGTATLTQSQTGRTTLQAQVGIAGAALGPALGGVMGGIIAGTGAGTVNGYLADGTLKGALTGGLSGGLFGGIGGYYGDTWSWSRVALNGMAGGVSAQARGGSFVRGMGISLGVSILSYAAVEMRTAMIEQSCGGNGANCSGQSAGFKGDGIKVGGGRFVEGIPGEAQPISWLGGRQGGDGSIFGVPYTSGSFADITVEAYAGPHDFLNSGYWYNDAGNAINYHGVAAVFGEVLNFSNVFVASPFVGASVTPNFAYQYFAK
jgi:RHS repeat-associated protein